MTDLLVLAAVVFVFGLVSRRLEGTVLTAPIVFVLAGALLGSAALGLVEFGLDEHTVLLVGEVALAIVLFTDAARINLSIPVAEIIRIVATELLAYRRTRQEADEPALPTQPTGSGLASRSEGQEVT